MDAGVGDGGDRIVSAIWRVDHGSLVHQQRPGGYLTCTWMLADPMTPCTTQVLGFIPVTVNLCHALCHFVSGIIGLVAVLRRSGAIVYAVLCALCYLAWGFLGLIGGAHIRYHLGVDIFGTWVHVVEGVILFAIWLGYRLAVRSVDGVDRDRDLSIAR